MSKKLKILLIIVAILFLLGLFSLYINFLLQAPASTSVSILYEIKPDTPSLSIAEDLKNKGFIRSKWFFLICLKLKKGVIQAGTYELSPSNHLLKIVEILTSGEIKEWIVTFPEGFSIRDIGERLEKKKIIKKGELLYEASLVSKYQKEFSFLDEIKGSNLEGYLFPDTYRFPLDTTSEEIVKKQLSNFDKKINKDIREEITRQGKTLFFVITLASIVEREAQKPEDRPKIASVFLNRLEKSMKLEADPTIQYAKGSWDPITAEDYKIDSPYNTYKYPGLPPGPICNPGLASILAVLNPEKTDFFYFFHTKDGQTIYSQTQEEHERKANEYIR